jgi:hypothetical protein
MRYRKLRIVWSVWCAIACVLMIALWVRSYWRCDWINRLDKNKIQTSLGSNMGELIYFQIDLTSDPTVHVASHGWSYYAVAPVGLHESFWMTSINHPGYIRVGTPYWLPISAAVASASLPWLPWGFKRFSLRTMLIATTLVAVVLGLVVWLR